MEKKIALNKQYVLRGVKSKYSIINFITGESYEISNDEVLEALKGIDGTLTIKDIAKKINKNYEDLSELYEVFLEKNIVYYTHTSLFYEIPLFISNNENLLEEVHLDLTAACNLRCMHCFWGNNLNNSSQIDELSLDSWKLIIDQISDYGASKITLSGGEISLRKDLYEIIKYIFEKKMYISAIFTNGVNLSKSLEKSINFLFDNKIHTKFYISLDGGFKESHELIRGKGTFDKSIKFIKKLVKIKNNKNASNEITINSLIYQNNFRNMIRNAVFFDSLGIDRWRFTAGRFMGNLKTNQNLMVGYNELMKKYVELADYMKNSKLKMHINMENLITTTILKEKKVYIYPFDEVICDYKHFACSISPRGNIQFCTSWQSMNIGNVIVSGISELWNNSILREYKNMKINEIEDCKSCELLKYCGGGCRNLAETLKSLDRQACDKFENYKKIVVPYLKSQKVLFVEE